MRPRTKKQYLQPHSYEPHHARYLKPATSKPVTAITLEDDLPYLMKNDPQRLLPRPVVDARSVSNPHTHNQGTASFKTATPRYSRLALALKTKSRFAFLLHEPFTTLKTRCIMTIVLPHGLCCSEWWRKGKIRKQLIWAKPHGLPWLSLTPVIIFFGNRYTDRDFGI